MRSRSAVQCRWFVAWRSQDPWMLCALITNVGELIDAATGARRPGVGTQISAKSPEAVRATVRSSSGFSGVIAYPGDVFVLRREKRTAPPSGRLLIVRLNANVKIGTVTALIIYYHLSSCHTTAYGSNRPCRKYRSTTKPPRATVTSRQSRVCRRKWSNAWRMLDS